MAKTCIIYTGHTSTGETLNLDFFMEHGIVENEEADYFFVFNCGKQKVHQDILVKINSYKNTKIYVRENEGYDFGAWGFIIDQIDINDYDYFIFINQSARGPFLPAWFKEDKSPWYTIFTNMINDQTKLCGCSINYYGGKAHIQSFLLCTDEIGLSIGLKNNVFQEQPTKWQAVHTGEIAWSEKILKAGYNIESTLSAYKGYDFRTCSWGLGPHENHLNAGGKNSDPSFQGAYYGGNINPVEAIFIKTNRGISPSLINNHTIWMNRRHRYYP